MSETIGLLSLLSILPSASLPKVTGSSSPVARTYGTYPAVSSHLTFRAVYIVSWIAGRTGIPFALSTRSRTPARRGMLLVGKTNRCVLSGPRRALVVPRMPRHRHWEALPLRNPQRRRPMIAFVALDRIPRRLGRAEAAFPSPSASPSIHRTRRRRNISTPDLSAVQRLQTSAAILPVYDVDDGTRSALQTA